MLKRLKERIKKNQNEDTPKVSVKSRKLDNLSRSLDRYTEAISFAEAGQQDYAQEIIQKEVMEKPKILVVGHEDTFSIPLIDYSVGLAERMGYEIIALSCSSIGGSSTKFLSPFREKISKDFESGAKKGFEALQKKTQEQGIPCTHLCKFGDLNDCIKQIHKEVRRIEFVLTEPEEDAKREGFTQAIPVFSMVHY
jgi:hypothetical protein